MALSGYQKHITHNKSCLNCTFIQTDCPSIFFLFFFFEYKIIFRSSVYSFGHSDPDPRSVWCVPYIFYYLQAQFLQANQAIFTMHYLSIVSQLSKCKGTIQWPYKCVVLPSSESGNFTGTIFLCATKIVLFSVTFHYKKAKQIHSTEFI